MRLSQLFYNVLNINYIHVENSGDYAIRTVGDTLYIYLECSNGIQDWKNNLDFPFKPYKRMKRTVWLAHRGFLRVWKSIEEHLEKYILDKRYKKIVSVGYSHGAGLSTLCHEYIWYNREDIRDKIQGYAFASPRVIWGIKTKELNKRWERFLVIRNINDIVTHLPPFIFGYFHVGKMLKIGKRGNYSLIDAHRPENIMRELLVLEGNQKY